jgi:hypothetical protein
MSDRTVGDCEMAHLARSLADALSTFAHSRSDDDRKKVAELQTELCAARRVELTPKVNGESET